MQQYKQQQTIYRRGLTVSYGDDDDDDDDDDEPPKGAQIACSIQLTPEAATLNELVAGLSDAVAEVKVVEVNLTALRAAEAKAKDFAAAEARAEALWGTRRELEAEMVARNQFQ